MAALIQYAFNNQNQWKSAGLPKLVDTAHSIVELGSKDDGKWYVEVLFENTDEVPDNGLLDQKAVEPKPHHFIGYPTLDQYEQSKQSEV
jgi:hypothetical protein